MIFANNPISVLGTLTKYCIMRAHGRMKVVEKKERIVIPKYQQIAADVASKIANGQYQEGQKIYARSSLAIQYGVSSETARRAISILQDMSIVSATKGSGVTITSMEKAMHFVKQFNEIQSFTELKADIMDSINRQYLEFQALQEHVNKLIDRTDRFKSINPFIPFEITITNKTSQIGKSVSENNFWHHTNATIIAIKRDDELIISPGPFASFMAGDIFFFIGDEDCHERVKHFLYGESGK